MVGSGELRGRSVLVLTRDQLTTALALIELDGIARRLVLCPPDLRFEHVPYVIATAEVDALVSDQVVSEVANAGVECVVTCSPSIAPVDSDRSGGPSNRMDSLFIRYDRSAKDDVAHVVEPGRSY